MRRLTHVYAISIEIRNSEHFPPNFAKSFAFLRKISVKTNRFEKYVDTLNVVEPKVDTLRGLVQL